MLICKLYWRFYRADTNDRGDDTDERHYNTDKLQNHSEHQ